MRRFAWISALVCSLYLTSTLHASEFDWIARNVERESGCKRTHIPFFGLAKFAVAISRPAGTSELNLAVFEHSNMPAEQLSAIIEDAVGPSWNPLVRVRSRHGEATTIYAQQDGNQLRMLIGTLDHGEATLVQFRLNVKSLLRFVDDAQRHDRNREE